MNHQTIGTCWRCRNKFDIKHMAPWDIKNERGKPATVWVCSDCSLVMWGVKRRIDLAFETTKEER